eukprot:g7766.t1
MTIIRPRRPDKANSSILQDAVHISVHDATADDDNKSSYSDDDGDHDDHRLLSAHSHGLRLTYTRLTGIFGYGEWNGYVFSTEETCSKMLKVLPTAGLARLKLPPTCSESLAKLPKLVVSVCIETETLAILN